MIDPMPLRKFASRCQAAAKAKAKEVRIDIYEAMEITAAIMSLLADKPISSPDTPSQVQLDGGNFS